MKGEIEKLATIVTLLGGNAHPLVPGVLGAMRPVSPPGFESFGKSDFFRIANPDAPTPSAEQKATFEEIWNGARIAQGGSSSPAAQEAWPTVEVLDDEIRAYVLTDLTFPATSEYARGRIILSIRDPSLVPLVRDQRAAAIANPSAEAGESQESALGRKLVPWRVIGIESDLKRVAFSAGPGGSQRPGGPGAPPGGGPPQ